MNFKNTCKRFFTLDRHHAEGFTLVELIVVIAILAILAGIAVPAYSGYITNTNIAADEQLLADVEHALHLAFYADPDFVPGSVMICATQNPTAENESLMNALTATFGDLSTVRLKYDGWSSDYTESSFCGNEADLLGQVDTVTDMLEDAIADNASLVGPTFGGYLEDNEIDSTDNAKVADAAVLYVAQNTAGMTDTQREAYLNCLATFPAKVAAGTFIADFTGIFGGMNVASATAMYAFAEAYFMYEATNNKTEGQTALREGIAAADVSDKTQALNNIFSAINSALQKADNDLANKYFTGGADSQATKDGNAYLDIMDKVSGNQSMFKDKLGQENAFSTAGADLFLAYVDGAAFVKAEILDDGTLNVVLPELDK